MTKEKIKTFVKDHKREIIVVAMVLAGTACAIIGIKKIKICRNQGSILKGTLWRLKILLRSVTT